MIRIVPALIAETRQQLLERFAKLKDHTRWFHVDVMDGQFVPATSNWFDFSLPTTHQYEIHLMVEDPLGWTKQHYTKGDVIIANSERLNNPQEYIAFLKQHNKGKAVAVNPETPLQHIRPYLQQLDRVLVLCVRPGQYGAPFLPETVTKVRELKNIFKGEIEVDGNQNPQTVPLTIGAGANIVTVGSYLQKAEDPGRAMEELGNVK